MLTILRDPADTHTHMTTICSWTGNLLVLEKCCEMLYQLLMQNTIVSVILKISRQHREIMLVVLP